MSGKGRVFTYDTPHENEVRGTMTWQCMVKSLQNDRWRSLLVPRPHQPREHGKRVRREKIEG
ncbi:hypothetical protein DAI22_11g174500 [Oryza sativa Japonica Group]|nr:hypothetical protein DAI22_11g174500 [Oryza sativa Japonica Group]KAF2911379.1 hypothetical protein DAI22_11g174500 [Oryza sativa Japonica Group]